MMRPFLAYGYSGIRLPTVYAPIVRAPDERRVVAEWLVVKMCESKFQAMTVAKALMRSKFRAGPNSSVGAYYRCAEHEGCKCEYRVRYSRSHGRWLVAKRNFEEHESLR